MSKTYSLKLPLLFLVILVSMGLRMGPQQTFEKASSENSAISLEKLNGTVAAVDQSNKVIVIRRSASQREALAQTIKLSGMKSNAEVATDVVLRIDPKSTRLFNNQNQPMEFTSLKKGDPVTVVAAVTEGGRLQVFKVSAQVACTPDFCAFKSCKGKCGVKPCQCNK